MGMLLYPGLIKPSLIPAAYFTGKNVNLGWCHYSQVNYIPGDAR